MALNRQKSSQSFNWRENFVGTAILLLFLVLVIKLGYVQLIKHSTYKNLAEQRHSLLEEILAERGEVYVVGQNSQPKPIVINQKRWHIIAVPARLQSVAEKNEIISKLLAQNILDEETLQKRLANEKSQYAPLLYYADDTQKVALTEINPRVILALPAQSRFYPDGEVFGFLTGFMLGGPDERKASYGLEEYWNEELAGQAGFLKTEKDALGNIISIGNEVLQPAKNGETLFLTIDYSLQYFACSRLAEWVKIHGADSGSVVILNPQTGAVLTMCSAPTFDPNKFSEQKDSQPYSNQAINFAYEPGSVFKAITLAAALDQGKITPETTFVDPGEIMYEKFPIRNSQNKKYGTVNMKIVLDESINTGAIFAMKQIGKDKFRDYVAKFGFGLKTGIELPNEVAGSISSLDRSGEVFAATGSFGQGLTVTPLQLASAFIPLANKGKLFQPYVVDKIKKADGTMVATKPQLVRQVISEKTASVIAGMLVSVVENGHGKKAGVKGYYIAGKTGTAQIVKENELGYIEGANNGSFVGFGPVEDPKFVMAVRIERPRDVQFAESSAAPLFGEIAKFFLTSKGIAPTRK